MNYKINSCFSIDVGFEIDAGHVERAIHHANTEMKDVPFKLFRTIDFKTISTILGSAFCEGIEKATEGVGIVNPAEHGFPDVIPAIGNFASDKELRRYPTGLEVKCTIGGVETGAKLKAGQTRIGQVRDLTWKAHHDEVERLMGLVFDFVNLGETHSYPHITGVFYSDRLHGGDWGKMNDGKGRNTNVTNMKKSGKTKMGNGWIAILDDREYIDRYQKLLKFDHRYGEFFD